MKLKTALELIADDVAALEASSNEDLGNQMLELVARRAREEMREALADAADACAKVGIVTAETPMYIRKIWVQP